MSESEAPETEAEVMRRGAAILAERLPAGWSARLIAREPNQRIDGLIEAVSYTHLDVYKRQGPTTRPRVGVTTTLDGARTLLSGPVNWANG